ncbi:MAG: Uncharacterised protein [Gammaproteobacteria bacterium]|nr:MAG: Uncharacterised protein [Gammaproteobacteria bacterium]
MLRRSHPLIAPDDNESSGSTINRSGSKYWCTPKPSQVWHAPNGLLNEKIRGSSSGMECPQTEHANFDENIRGSKASSIDWMIICPSDRVRPVSIDSAKRRRCDWSTFNRSTTASIECFFFLSSAGTSSKSITRPSRRTRINP